MNWFVLAVVTLFLGAMAVEGAAGNWWKALFYLLSALINLNVIFLK